MKKRILSMLLVLVMVICMIPVTGFASAQETVYISVSYDGQYKTGTDSIIMAYVPVSLSALQEIDLDSYGLGDYKYDADEDGDYEITALHLYIYAHEKLMGLKWSDVSTSGAAGSIFFASGLFGFPDSNLNYYYNGDYPIDEKLSASWGYTVGATADHIVLKNGDCMDIAGFDNSNWMIYGATFRYFTESGKVTRAYRAAKGEALTVNVSTVRRDWSSTASALNSESGAAVYYSQTAFAADAASVTTDDSGNASITFDKVGKWYIWSYGYNDGSVSCSPAYAEVDVAWKNTGNVTSDWSNFRNSLNNMAITDAKTPVSAATTVAKWTVAKGTSWSDTPSGMIIADDALIFMGQTSITKADLQTGAVLATNKMSSSAGFAIISPTYGDGLIFCPLSGGKIEAFDAKTLDSIWIFKDELGGQNNTPVTYYDGYVYTGYWNGEAKNSNFVCVDASTGELVWSKTTLGGHYWAGSTVVGDAVIVGTDDGTTGWTGDSHLYALDRLTGEVISDITLTGMGDQRSAVAYSAEKGRVFFTTKNGYIASAAVDPVTGALSDLKSNKISTQATATPVVYGDKVYVGAGGGMQVGTTSGNLFAVDADTLEYLYEVPLKGYPQGSIMISTAYLADTGKLYCYSTYNSQPGGMTLIKIDPNATTADSIEVEEIFDAGEHPQYCLISPICGPDGTIYYRNDSGCLFALTINNAYLTGLTASAGVFTEEFASNCHSYELVVPVGTQNVTLTPTACEGGTAEAVTVNLADGVADATVTVIKGSESRSYTVSVRTVSTNASLGSLKVNESNSYGGTVSPDFSADEHYYTYFTAGENRTFVNVWPDAVDEHATLKVFLLDNAAGKNAAAINEDGSLKVTAKNGGHGRYAVYFVDDTKPMALRVEVTSENGETDNYYLVISKASAAEDGQILLDKIKVDNKLAADQAAADPVIALIDAIGTVTLDSKNAIAAARTAYDALTTDQKTLVTNYATLTAAEARLEVVKDEATANPVKIFVTISDRGSVVLFQQNIAVTDVNNNGIFDVDDALYAAHETGYTGGAAAGYATQITQYGLGISKLWGDTSYCYGYWLNNASCWSLEDVVAEGNHLVAFVYTDGTNWSDAYTRFEKFDYSATAGKALTVKLDKAGYDANWNTVFSAHAGATIAVYDNSGKLLTAGYAVVDNQDGTYTVTVASVGNYYVVATDTDPLTVPAVCAVVVSEDLDKKAADAVIEKINAIGTVTKDSKGAIEAARAAYDALTAEQKALVTNYDALTAAEKALADLNELVDPDIPQTGDDTDIMLYTTIMLVSLMAIAALLLTARKKYKSE